jgi:hypothetical protein
VPAPRLPALLLRPGARLGTDARAVQVGLDGLDDSIEHGRGGMSVVCPDRGGIDLPTATGAMAHQLIDDPGGDAAHL